MKKNEKGSSGANEAKPHKTRAKGEVQVAKPRKKKAATTAPEADAWAATRAAAADRINTLTTAECMRLFERGVHPSAFVLEIDAHPDIAEFERKAGGDVLFSMGATLRENGTSSIVSMDANVLGTERDGHVVIHAIHTAKSQQGGKLPELKPLSEIKARFQRNSYAASISIEGLATTQLDRTDITMRDILDGFMLAHRGLSLSELNKRYTYAAASRIMGVMLTVAPYVSSEKGRMTDWPGWPGDVAERHLGRHPALDVSTKKMHVQHAKGYYGIGRGQRLLPESDYAEIKVNDEADPRETVALLQSALSEANLPSRAEAAILAAIETLTVKRGKVYANEEQ